jgi:hypothetical protein
MFPMLQWIHAANIQSYRDFGTPVECPSAEPWQQGPAAPVESLSVGRAWGVCEDGPRDYKSLALLASYLVAAVLLGLVVAIVSENRGSSRLSSIALGATFGFFATWLPLVLVQSIRCALWRFTRGYPFVQGSIVHITSGPHRGRCGRLVGVGHVPWIVEVEFLTSERGRNWYSAGRLRQRTEEEV